MINDESVASDLPCGTIFPPKGGLFTFYGYLGFERYLNFKINKNQSKYCNAVFIFYQEDMKISLYSQQQTTLKLFPRKQYRIR